MLMTSIILEVAVAVIAVIAARNRCNSCRQKSGGYPAARRSVCSLAEATMAYRSA